MQVFNLCIPEISVTVVCGGYLFFCVEPGMKFLFTICLGAIIFLTFTEANITGLKQNICSSFVLFVLAVVHLLFCKLQTALVLPVKSDTEIALFTKVFIVTKIALGM